MEIGMKQLINLCAAISLISLSTHVFAQQESDTEDNTGTNPIKFARDLRVYNEYSWLNTPGDGSQNLTTMEFRTPFADGKWQWRVRARHNSLKADLNDNGNNDIDKSGAGDIDMRFLTVPWLDMENRQAVAVGLEVFLDTASNDALGSGTTSLGPQVFYVKFLERGLFAPGLQYKKSIDEDTGRPDTDLILIDLNYLLMARDGQSWFFTDPQLVFDQETNQEYAIVDFEFGFMMSKWFDNLPGQSFYIRPSVGVGTNRPADLLRRNWLQDCRLVNNR